jgi:hypothetical protein
MARNEFRPLYYTKQYEEDKSKIEMSFGEVLASYPIVPEADSVHVDLTHYQPQFKGKASTPGEKGVDRKCIMLWM